MIDYLAGILGLAFFGWISIATKQHFRSSKYPLGMYVISVLSLIGLVPFVYYAARAELVFGGLTLVLIIIAFALFLWAVGHSKATRLSLALDDEMQSEQIIRTGPWRYMRHPFYAAYILFWLACAVATQHLVSAIVFVALLGIYTASARREEQALSSGPLRKDYIAYRETVGFFYPRFPLRS